MRHAATFRLGPLVGLCAVGGILCAGQANARLEGAQLVSPLRSYTLTLSSFVPAPGKTMGVFLKVGINGGRPLRLLLDSGAEHIVMSAGAARALSLSREARLSLIGFGEPARGGFLAIARTVDIGPLSFRNCPVDVVDHRVVGGADGVLPLALFSDFLVRLDFPGRVLELTPYDQASEPHERFTRALVVKAVLFLRTVLDGPHSGYFLLDTGAAHNALTPTTAKELGGPGIGSVMRSVQGAGGASEVPQMKSAVHFRTAGQEITSDDVVLVDLDTFSRYNGVEVAGLLGYPALSRYVLTVNYRDSLVRIQPAGKP